MPVWGSSFGNCSRTMMSLTLCITFTTGSKYGGKSYGSLDANSTVILIEADESTPLLVDRRWALQGNGDGNNNQNINFNNNNNNNNNDGNGNKDKDDGQPENVSLWSYGSKDSQTSGHSTKSFRSHFWELKVLMFALLLIFGLGIAIYLLIIESRFPLITFSLDLVHHDVWSLKQLPMGHRLSSNDVDSVVITQTGSQRCDNIHQCIPLLQQLQEEHSQRVREELPYNFLIGNEGVAFDVRGWNHESGLQDVDKPHTLVIGFIGNFDNSPPSLGLLHTLRCLLIESVKRRKLQKSYQVIGLSKFCPDCHYDGPKTK
ncbi:peptidoglycan-recognition protein LF-like isoform X1 [Musca domestica]|uniref:Peptidoglycan-recognition protein LF-like isoform X1 n=1 Tax=Musca domestica TaxID=7370 RepID=A0ABM3ULG0_MUSDO|nr:peptidoglycan-recognition protein LF-like isoform X1 [Musca domestica]